MCKLIARPIAGERDGLRSLRYVRRRRADHARHRHSITGRGKNRKKIASRVDAAEPPEHAVLPSDGPGKGLVYIKSYDAHAVPIDWLVNKTGAIAGNTTSLDPLSQRGPGNESRNIKTACALVSNRAQLALLGLRSSAAELD
jgi:hypothetical protein